MNVTNNLKLPQYTGEDIFDLQDINKAYNSIDKAYGDIDDAHKEVVNIKNEIPKTNATAEVINARGGKETLGKRLDNIAKYSTATIDNEKYGISDNFTNAIETTNGINKALQELGKDNLIINLSNGKYLIDKNNNINIPDNVIFNLNGSILKKEANDLEKYAVVKFDYTKNSKIINGIISGDKLEHNYIGGKTHETGHGIHLLGASNCIVENIDIFNCTGDGICISNGYDGLNSIIQDKNFQHTFGIGFDDFSLGDIDNIQCTYYMTEYIDLSNLRKDIEYVKNNKLQIFGDGYGVTNLKKNYVNIHFYNSKKSLLSVIENINIGKDFYVPEQASFIKLSLNDDEIRNDVYVTISAYEQSSFCEISNCKIHDCRRLGISGVGITNSKIHDCEIYNIKGTDPQYGIDIEDGSFLNHNVDIYNNIFYNNFKGDVTVTIGANNINIYNNNFEKALTTMYKDYDINIYNNIFRNSAITLSGYNINFSDNTCYNCSFKITGDELYQLFESKINIYNLKLSNGYIAFYSVKENEINLNINNSLIDESYFTLNSNGIVKLKINNSNFINTKKVATNFFSDLKKKYKTEISLNDTSIYSVFPIDISNVRKIKKCSLNFTGQENYFRNSVKKCIIEESSIENICFEPLEDNSEITFINCNIENLKSGSMFNNYVKKDNFNISIFDSRINCKSLFANFANIFKVNFNNILLKQTTSTLDISKYNMVSGSFMLNSIVNFDINNTNDNILLNNNIKIN